MVDRDLYVANVGDSRCVIGSRGKAINMSVDHKPDRVDERRRIESLGGVVARTPEEADYLQSNFVQRRCMDLFYSCCVQGPRAQYDGPARIFPGAMHFRVRVAPVNSRRHTHHQRCFILAPIEQAPLPCRARSATLSSSTRSSSFRRPR